MKRFILLCMALSLSACSQEPETTTVEVCKAEGCSEQEKLTVTRETSVPDREQLARIASLEELANEDPDAAFDLGMRYLRGDEIGRSSHEGLSWLRNAGDRGQGDAQLALGRIYAFGYEESGVDLIEAEKWLILSTEQGSAEARDLLAEISDPLSVQRLEDRERFQPNRRYDNVYIQFPFYHYRWNADRRFYYR